MVLLSNNKNANLSKTMIVYALVWPFLLLDVVVYILSLAWIFKKKNKCSNKLQSIAVGAATPTHGCPRRSPKSVDALFKSNMTMHQAMMQAVKQFGGLSSKTNQHVAMVTRKFVELRKVHETDKFPTKIYDDSQVEEITYQQLGDLIRNFGFGLQSLTGGAQNSTIVIYEETCKQWSISMHGALSQSMVVATCYATLGDDAVVSAVNETQASMLLLNWKHVEKFLKLAPNQMPNLHTIIASTHEMPMAGGTTTSSVLGNNSGGGSNNNNNNNTNKIRVILWDDVIDLGQKQQKNSSIQAVPPQVHDTAVIMYTSGSTGKVRFNSTCHIECFLCREHYQKWWLLTHIICAISLSLSLSVLAQGRCHDA
jgi:AMP-binding enzyme